MKMERKESLIGCFPDISAAQQERMKGRGAGNFVVFLTHGRELFARCFHRYYAGEIVERQRYVFAKDGCVRFGRDNGGHWSVRTKFREPVFCQTSYGYSFDNSYTVIDINAIARSDMRYSEYSKYKGELLISYLQLYCSHPNLEYLMKQNYDVIDEEYTGYWGGNAKLVLSDTVNWKSNNLLQMLNLNRVEFKMLKGQEYLYDRYIRYRKEFPKLRPEDILNLAKVFKNEHGTLKHCVEITGLTPQRIARYLSENDICIRDYLDYTDQCRQLKYDTHNTAISMPYDFQAMHERLSEIIVLKHDELVMQKFEENYPLRRKLEYASRDLFLRQPKNLDEIVDEGRKLSHCVGGYAERHAEGKLHILFLRKLSEPDVPYYTMEISTAGKIIQCRGYKNNVEHNGGTPKPQEIIDFEKEYQAYLDTLKNKKARKTA